MLSLTNGWVYFVRHQDAVKIGVTRGAPLRRFTGLCAQSPVPLELAAVQPGYREEEAALHRRFVDAHLHYEWFRQTDELRELIEGVRARYGPPNEKGYPEYYYRLLEIGHDDQLDTDIHIGELHADARKLYREVDRLEERGEDVPFALRRKLERTASLACLASGLPFPEPAYLREQGEVGR